MLLQAIYEPQLQISSNYKEVNQKFPQMMLIRLKTRDFRTKKIYDAVTKSLIFQGYGVARCPILRYAVLYQTVLTIVY